MIVNWWFTGVKSTTYSKSHKKLMYVYQQKSLKSTEAVTSPQQTCSLFNIPPPYTIYLIQFLVFFHIASLCSENSFYDLLELLFRR